MTHHVVSKMIDWKEG